MSRFKMILPIFFLALVLAAPLEAQKAPAPAKGPAAELLHKAYDVPLPTTGLPDYKVTEAYVRMAAREAYFWGWPMANIYSRRLTFDQVKEPSLIGGIVPAAPLNYLSMLTDYIDPAERLVACPNQDVVYGASTLALDRSPVVVQVPDFGGRFWVYQAVDLRTDGFAELGSMYGSKPGFYMLVGPDWQGKTPKGITKVFRSSTNSGMLIPRVFQNDSAEDKKAVQPLIAQIDAYPLAEYDGKMKTKDWTKLPAIQSETQGSGQGGETKWVRPETFFDVLPAILRDARPLPGEEARYMQMQALADIAKKDPEMKKAMIDEAAKADEDLIGPLLRLSNFGLILPHHWGTLDNAAAFGIDYYIRTAVARSNILTNKVNETKYFYQDMDENGQRLNGAGKYTLTFDHEGIPVRGFWSLSLYNEEHFFVPNELKRFSIGTKSQGLKYNDDGTLTLYVQSQSPGPDKEANWLPAPEGKDFSLYIRAYWPKPEVLNGKWLPPAVVLVKE